MHFKFLNGHESIPQQHDFHVVVESNKASHNLADARQLREVAQQLTGIQFDQMLVRWDQS